MLRNDLTFKGRLIGDGLLGGWFDTGRYQRQSVQKPAAQPFQLLIADRQMGQLLGQDVQKRRPLNQGAQQRPLLARAVEVDTGPASGGASGEGGRLGATAAEGAARVRAPGLG